MDDGRDTKIEEALRKVAELLASEDDVQLPDSLKSDKLIHLLEKETQQKKSFDITRILKSKAALPILSTAVAAVLLITIMPRLSKTGQMGINSIAQKSVEADAYTEAATTVEDAILAEDASVNTGGEEYAEDDAAQASADSGGEDLTSYFEGDGTAPTDPKSAPKGNEAVLEESPKTGGSDDTTSTNKGEVISSRNDPASQVVDPEPKDKPANSVSNDKQASPAVARSVPAIGGSGSSYYLPATWGNYSFYWRTNDPTDPDYKGYSVVLEVIDATSKEVYLQKGISEMYQVNKLVISDDNIYLLGVSSQGAVLSGYSGLKSANLSNISTNSISGSVFYFFNEGRYFHVLSGIEATGEGYINTSTLDKSSNASGVVVYSLNLDDSKLTNTAIIGVSSEDCVVNGDVINMQYTDTSDIQRVAQATIEGSAVTIEYK